MSFPNQSGSVGRLAELQPGFQENITGASLSWAELSCSMFRAPLSQRASLWPSFPSYPVSWDKASHCEKKKKGGKEGRRERKQERDTICGTHWISFVMFVKPAGNAYLVRGGGVVWDSGLCRRGRALRTVGKAGPLRRKCASHTRTSPSCELFVWMCVRRRRW